MTTVENQTSHDISELLDCILAVARKIRATPFSDSKIISLKPVERAVIRHVHEFPGASPSAIAKSLEIQRANLSRSLNLLEDFGLISRRQCEPDGRFIGIWPTERAQQNWSRIKTDWATRAGNSLGTLSADEIAHLLRQLRKIEHGLDAVPKGEQLLNDEG